MREFCAAGVCPVSALRMDEPSRAWLERLCPGAQSVLVFLFPYFAGEQPGNLSLYARGRDYHVVLRQALTPVAERFCILYPDYRFTVAVDDSPIPEVAAAVRAGLGAAGENGLLIHETYGSYVFIGTIVTDRSFPVEPREPRPCLRCGACRRACPGGVVGAPGGKVSRCLSALTQRGGELSVEEAKQLRRHPLIWGCDICQTVCPMNRNAVQTFLPDFREQCIASLALPDLEGLTRRGFLEKYPERAFTWRGPAPLRRNLLLRQQPGFPGSFPENCPNGECEP